MPDDTYASPYIAFPPRGTSFQPDCSAPTDRALEPPAVVVSMMCRRTVPRGSTLAGEPQ